MDYCTSIVNAYNIIVKLHLLSMLSKFISLKKLYRSRNNFTLLFSMLVLITW